MADGSTSGGAAGGTIRVTASDVMAAAQSAQNAAGEIQTDLEELKSYVVGVEATWQGVASQTFQTLMVDYQIFANMLNQSLTDIASGLRGNYVNYTASEEQNISSLKAVNGAVPGANFA
jgi:WXG100 family type VII secretion target